MSKDSQPTESASQHIHTVHEMNLCFMSFKSEDILNFTFHIE